MPEKHVLIREAAELSRERRASIHKRAIIASGCAGGSLASV
jgi:hypothetical protein